MDVFENFWIFLDKKRKILLVIEQNKIISL